MCNNKDIKEILPVYQEDGLEQTERLKVEGHLASCADCRAELSLLRMMSEEVVPDPGEAFWATMPDRVHRAVQEDRSKRRSFDLARLVDLMTVPRWAAWTAAAVGMVLLMSWFVFRTAQKELAPALPQENEFVYEYTLTTAEPENVAELSGEELYGVDEWAGRELSAIATEAGQIMTTSRDTDLYEELAELNEKEAKRLSTMIDQFKQEG